MSYNMLNCTFAGRPGPCGPAATGITVAWPGHDCDCVQAPFDLLNAGRSDMQQTCSQQNDMTQGPGPSAGSAVGNPCIPSK